MLDVLTMHPVLTNELFNRVRFGNRFGALDEHLGDIYQEIGPEYEVDGAVFPCAHCGIPLRPTAEGSWWCEREECGTGNTVSPGDPLDWDATVRIQVDRRHRQFVFGPGRVALRIANNLTLPGVTVRRWPVHGPGDLRVEVPGVHPLTVAVVDWHSPALLGRAIATAVTWWGTDTTVWVVAQYRVDADPDYLRVVREHAAGATGTPQVRSEEEFIDMVRLCSRRSGHA